LSDIVVLILGFIALAILLGGVVFRVSKEKTKDGDVNSPNYKTFFILGACFLPVGITIALSTDNIAFNGIAALGLIYMIIGLANKDKWE